MIQKILLTTTVFLTVGCASTYKQSHIQEPSAKLDSTQGVLISVPEDGWYENIQYRNSGRMTANAVRAAFSKYAKRVDLATDCKEEDCLNSIEPNKYGYFVKPVILGWEDRATEWSGRPDRIEIQLVIFDAVTKQELANASYTGKSKLASMGGDQPQDLLPEPTNAYVNTLFK